MRGSTKSLPAKIKFQQIYPVKTTGALGTVTPKKKENSDSGEGLLATEKKTDPIVTFSRPPPFPPIMGPLVVLSLLETLTSRDKGDDADDVR